MTSIDDKCETYVSIYNEMLNNLSIELISGYLFHVYMEIVNVLYDNCNNFENTPDGVEFEFSDGTYITYNNTNEIRFISKDSASNIKEDEKEDENMIIIRLDRMMADRKISLNDLADKVGMTNVNLSNLKTGKMKGIRFETLEAICKVLQCQPGDLMEYKED